MKSLILKVGMAPGDVDLWEINEAFSVVVLANMKLDNLDHDKLASKLCFHNLSFYIERLVHAGSTFTVALLALVTLLVPVGQGL